MKKINKIVLLSASVLSSVFLSSAYAQSSNNTVISADNRATGMFLSLAGIPPLLGSINLGYQFTPYWGIQAGALGLWQSVTGFDLDTAGIYDVALRGVLPLANRVELFGKLGVGVIHGEQQIWLPFNLGTIKQSSESVGATYGLGLGFCFTPRWVLTIEGSGIYSTGSQVIRSGFKTVPMIGLTYHFGA